MTCDERGDSGQETREPIPTFTAATAEVKQDRKKVPAANGSARAQAKRARPQRVAHATARLNKCQAAPPSSTTGA